MSNKWGAVVIFVFQINHGITKLVSVLEPFPINILSYFKNIMPVKHHNLALTLDRIICDIRAAFNSNLLTACILLGISEDIMAPLNGKVIRTENYFQ